MLTTHPFDDDKLREECGIFGVEGAEDAAAMVALGLHALQHRGQEAAGITSRDGDEFYSHRALGPVAGNFDQPENMVKLRGLSACGHVRYSTTGGGTLRNVQPLQDQFSNPPAIPKRSYIWSRHQNIAHCWTNSSMPCGRLRGHIP